MKTSKKIIKVVVFVLLFVIIYSKISPLFSIGINATSTVGTYGSFYKEPDDTLQIVTLGNSRMTYGWNALELWEHTGITSYNMSTHTQPVVLIKYLMEEVRKTQKDPLFIVDMNCLRKKQVATINDATIRRVTDSIPQSINRINMINEALKYRVDEVPELSYYWNFAKYHSRWTELKKSDFMGKENVYKSMQESKNLINVTALEKPVITSKTSKLDDLQISILEELLAYIEENKINVLFVSLPAYLEKSVAKEMNQIMLEIENRGYNFLNLNTDEMYKQLKISFKTDFIDKDHLNLEGSKKLMAFMEDYLKSKYSFTDQRGIEGYESWDEAVVAYEKYIEKIKLEQENEQRSVSG